MKTIAITKNLPIYHDGARFWVRVFGVNFVLGVVTGIPIELQFGTNWAQFSRDSASITQLR